MRRTSFFPRITASSNSEHGTEDSDRARATKSIFEPSIRRSKDDVDIFDLSAIRQQDTAGSLTSWADRLTVGAFHQIMGGDAATGVPSFDSQADSSGDVQSSDLASDFDAKTSWYLDSEQLKPGTARWKLERDVISLCMLCEEDFGQAIRWEFLCNPGLTPEIPGSARLREAFTKNPSALAAAECCAFNASVIKEIAESINGPLQVDLNIHDPLQRIDYETASPEDRERLIQGVQLQISLLLGQLARSPTIALSFQWDVVRNWLHMIAFNDKRLPHEWYKETFAATNSAPRYTIAHGQYCFAVTQLAKCLVEKARIEKGSSTEES
jgi:hypothetical protein